jgi:EAL domain-containing protein (putative c-di-GMP-specific phosphodiesterase class I)/ActR/RegA family two-component response regulator
MNELNREVGLTMVNAGHVLVIDDDSDMGAFVAEAAQSLGMRCTSTTDPAQLPALFSPQITLILLDLMMPDIDGIEVLRILSELRCKARIVLMSGLSKRVLETAEKLARALGLTIAGHLQKPFRLAALEELLRGYIPEQAMTVAEEYIRPEIADAELLRAIRNHEIVLHYQPQIEIATGAVAGLEVLARWQHPEIGLLLPDCFIRRLEDLQWIDEFGWLVADCCLDEVSAFISQGLSIPRIALNVSVQSLRNLRFTETLLEIAKRHGIPAGKIAVEITESRLLNETSTMLDVLTRLRMKNVQLSIDDFGTGYAMMQHLVNIPATELKIDRAFVQNIYLNDSDRVMVEKTIEIGHELGMTVTAEGVENLAQLDFLRQKGCDCAQGYLFSHPLPAPEIASWLARSGSARAPSQEP